MLQNLLKLYRLKNKVDNYLTNLGLPVSTSRHYSINVPPRIRIFPPGISRLYLTVNVNQKENPELYVIVDKMNNPARNSSGFYKITNKNISYYDVPTHQMLTLPYQIQTEITIKPKEL